MNLSYSIDAVLNKYRSQLTSEREKGTKFEELIKKYLLIAPEYANSADPFETVWMWSEFPAKDQFGGKDIGIDLVAKTKLGDFWAIQCKCYAEHAEINKREIDSFLGVSSRGFKFNEKEISFARRLWVSTTDNWNQTAEITIKNQNPPFARTNLSDLRNSPIDWEKLETEIHIEKAKFQVKELKEHQKEALNSAVKHYKENERGKMIMACGTGKTFTSLRIAEKFTNGNGMVLFLVPSIALVQQALKEWTANAKKKINAICVCSDSQVSKTKKENDFGDFSTIDLALPASTDAEQVKKQYHNCNKNNLIVIFSTYQSIDTIIASQKGKKSLPEFDLVICDEAHRTTGKKIPGQQDESNFIKVHNNDFIKAKKRLYMTATPRIFSENAKKSAELKDIELCSMDDETLYGKEFYHIGFGKAVEDGLLADYKVLVLTLSENDISSRMRDIYKNDENKEISTDDKIKLAGCIAALSKQIIGDDGTLLAADSNQMKRAVAFCSTIDSSKKIKENFNVLSKEYSNIFPKQRAVSVEAEHIDGGMGAATRGKLMDWLKADIPDGECRVLDNVRCLSEGVDVPSLDAILFLSARNSQVEVVQSVGRVMRTFVDKTDKKKEYGYIVIPVVVPANTDATEALNDNKRYKVIWQVLNALRAHDDRFEATINKIELNKSRPDNILVGRTANSFDENDEPVTQSSINSKQLVMQFEYLQTEIYAKMVEKVGDRLYWENWAKSVADIAKKITSRIESSLKNTKNKERFNNFLEELRNAINPSVSESSAIKMLSQHIITKPIFDALFKNYSFAANNPVSVAMQGMVDFINSITNQSDLKDLEKFYETVQKQAVKIDNAEGRQKLIIKLYDTFFKVAFPTLQSVFVIFYTPVEIVDFIIHSVDAVLKQEFKQNFGDENVSILDPFTGTGTFIVRLIQSGLIARNKLSNKYKNEIFANEIVLLAYYIATVNIEQAYHEATNQKIMDFPKQKTQGLKTEYSLAADSGQVKWDVSDIYVPFEGICLTDTFQLAEKKKNEGLKLQYMEQNSGRLEKQKKKPITIILGNPPYSANRKNANDDAKNEKYEILDQRVKETFVEGSRSQKTKSYDPYLRAFRFAADRLSERGIIAFITNSGWVDSGSGDMFRKAIAQEFDKIYVLDLLGNINKYDKKEGENVFNIKPGVAITILVKNGKKERKINNAEIFYSHIGFNKKQQEKFNQIIEWQHILNAVPENANINPDEKHDWLNQGDLEFDSLTPLAPEKNFSQVEKSVFTAKAIGVSTNRDPWVYNFCKKELESNIKATIKFYNEEVDKWQQEQKKDLDKTKIKWTRGLENDLQKGIKHKFNNDCFVEGMFRPFTKEHLYYDKNLIERPGQWSRLFPDAEAEKENLVICTSKGGFVFMVSGLVDLHFIGDTQCFPLYYYDNNANLFNQFKKCDGISDYILKFCKSLLASRVSKKDIFYYTYAFLHNEKFRAKFANNLKKELPRIAFPESEVIFNQYANIGRELAELHLNYEKQKPLAVCKIIYKTPQQNTFEYYSVGKMEFAKNGKEQDKTKIIYNSNITIENIPLKVYDYIIAGKSAVEWLFDQYQKYIDKDTRIENDPNKWAKENNEPRYILDLLLSVITLSARTLEIVEKIPDMEM
jgi:predicted helicase